MTDDFFIGWDAASGASSKRLVGWSAAAMIALAVLVASAIALAQRPFARAEFEFGVERTFEGRIEHIPYPVLVLARPGGAGESLWLLTVFGKHGADGHTLPFDGHDVQLTGSLIYRDRTTMLEIVPTSIEDRGLSTVAARPAEVTKDVTLRGEIVDSKCFLGVMKPGNLKPHRACATRCISGGVPPVLLVRGADGIATYYLLTDEHGAAVNDRILHLIAEEIEITGDVVVMGETRLLRADPDAYRRVE